MQDDKQFQIVPMTILLIVFGVHMRILLLVAMKILLNDRIAPHPKKDDFLNVEWLANFEHVVQSPSNTCLFGVHSWIHT